MQQSLTVYNRTASIAQKWRLGEEYWPIQPENMSSFYRLSLFLCFFFSLLYVFIASSYSCMSCDIMPITANRKQVKSHTFHCHFEGMPRKKSNRLNMVIYLFFCSLNIYLTANTWIITPGFVSISQKITPWLDRCVQVISIYQKGERWT